MKKKEESKKRERKKEVVVAAVAIYPAKFQLCFLEVRKYETSKSCVWTRCSTQEYVAHNYILHTVLKYESRKKAPRLWTMPNARSRFRLNVSAGSQKRTIDEPEGRNESRFSLISKK